MARACFVSDLHLFANRSRGDAHLERIRIAADEADYFVLGGDIFDFKWSTLGDLRASVDAAAAWIHDLCLRAPSTQVQFLLGNHDYHDEFIRRLPALSNQLPNFEWHRFYLRLGNTIFVHGDVADRRMTAQMLEERRSRWNGHRQRGRFHSRAYDLVVKSRVHMLVPRAVYPRRIVARRILSYLQDIGHCPHHGVEQVCFGHTHLPLADYRYGGLCFHNGGAPIGAGKFRILELELNGVEPSGLIGCPAGGSGGIESLQSCIDGEAGPNANRSEPQRLMESDSNDPHERRSSSDAGSTPL
jgi:UDP-2,3-diacylglucosamine pyrophosphatase LpxH